jgi:glutamyl-tRNA reductase
MQLFALGINHHTAPLSVREQVAFDLARLPQALNDLLRAKPVRSAMPCATCSVLLRDLTRWCSASLRSSAR